MIAGGATQYIVYNKRQLCNPLATIVRKARRHPTVLWVFYYVISVIYSEIQVLASSDGKTARKCVCWKPDEGSLIRQAAWRWW